MNTWRRWGGLVGKKKEVGAVVENEEGYGGEEGEAQRRGELTAAAGGGSGGGEGEGACGKPGGGGGPVKEEVDSRASGRNTKQQRRQ